MSFPLKNFRFSSGLYGAMLLILVMELPGFSAPSPQNCSEFDWETIDQNEIALKGDCGILSDDPLAKFQWHLKNEGQSGGTPGIDLDVQAAWQYSRGENVVIGMVSAGLQNDHPDLRQQFLSDLSFNFLDNNHETWSLDAHDTAVIGIAVASGNNGIGVSGVAPDAKFATIRIDTQDFKAEQVIANALSHKRDEIDIYTNSWGPPDSGMALAGPGELVRQALEDGAKYGRNGLGNIFVWAGGNGLTEYDNVNYDGYASSRYTIAVSAVDHHGRQGFYSEPGAAMFVAAPASGDGVGIVTTALVEDTGEAWDGYTTRGEMTSAAAPVVSGAVALMLGANPNLSWRDVQHILARTAHKNHPRDNGWTVNGGGYHVNHKYGFGLVDAGAAVAEASRWQAVPPEVSVSSGLLTINRSIPDDTIGGITSQVKIDRDIRVEWAEVVFEASHGRRGDLEVRLFSPDGTQSILAERHNDENADYERWVFSSMRHWGESSLGDWTLRVTDRSVGEVGTWDSWQLNLYGTAKADQNNSSLSDDPLFITLQQDG